MPARILSVASRPVRRAAAAGLLALLGTGLAAQSADGACPRELPVRVQALTANAAALERVALVRATTGAGSRVHDLHVVLRRGGRMVAQGSRREAFGGSVAVRLDFRRAAKPGRMTLLVSGRAAGCSSRQRRQRTLWLDGRDLPVGLVGADRDAPDGHLTVTLSGGRPISGLRGRILDAGGATLAEAARPSSWRGRTRLEFAPAPLPTGSRLVLLVTANVSGEQGRRAFADTLDLAAGSDPEDDVPAPTPSPAASGAVVGRAAVSWSRGRFAGADSASFSAPGIGAGQLVCRPDTQWVRFYPTVRSRDVAMTLWTFRDWERGSEVALREAQMTQYTGADFNEGLNKFTPAEKRSHGSFVGVIGDGLPAAGFAFGRAPAEIRVTFSWDFTDAANARCSVSATLTSEGPGVAGSVARGIALGWRGAEGVPADTTTAALVPGLGTVRLRCDAAPEGGRELVIEPGAPAGFVVTSYEGSERRDRTLETPPYVVALPNNGLVEASSLGGMPLRLLVASRWKVNDPDPAQNHCRLSAIVVAG